MVQLNFNARNVAPSTAMEALPSGWYDVMITESENKPTKAGTGSYLQLILTVASGEFSGRKLYARLNLDNPNPTAVQIAQAELSAICWVTGMPDAQDSQQLHGRPFKVLAKKVERNDKPGSFSNELSGFTDVNGTTPDQLAKGMGGQGGQPQQQYQPPQQQQQPPQGQQQYQPPAQTEQSPQQYQQQQPPAQTQQQQPPAGNKPPWEQ